MLAVVACACTGTTRYETVHDSGVPDVAWDAAVAGDADADSVTAVDAPADALPAACAEVGKGPGIESCCNGQLCHGTCDQYDGKFVCQCEMAPNCPPTGACCRFPNGVYWCVAPEDCPDAQ